jgi:hypothetical protein
VRGRSFRGPPPPNQGYHPTMTPPPAMADDIFGPDDDPRPATAEPDRLRLLRSFIVNHYRISDSPTSRIDGDLMARAFAVYSAVPNQEPQQRHRFYDDLRAMGLLVRPATNNRMTVFGVEELPHAAPELQQLEARWPDLAAQRQDQIIDRAVLAAQQAVHNTLVLTPAVIEESVNTTLEIMRTSRDEGRRLQAAAQIMSRGIPQLKAKEIDPVTIEAVTNGPRLSLLEVEAVLRANLVDGDGRVSGKGVDPDVAEGL